MTKMYNCMVFVFFAVVVFASIPAGYGFKCWLCSSEGDRRCGDPFNSTDTLRHEDCNPTYYASNNNRYVCRKVKYRGSDNEVMVSRNCVLDGEKDASPCSPSQLSAYAKVEHCSTCNTDLCNSAPALFQITSTIIGPVVVLLTKINIL